MIAEGKDIALLLNNFVWDVGLENGDLIGDGGLETAVVISLFTDKRVTEEQLPSFQTDRRGWWGDMIPVTEDDQIGSRLWTLGREKILNETLRLHEDYAEEALQWMIEDGVAQSISVEANYNEKFYLVLEITIIRPEQTETLYNITWDNQTAFIVNKGTNNAL